MSPGGVVALSGGTQGNRRGELLWQFDFCARREICVMFLNGVVHRIGKNCWFCLCLH